MLKFLHKLALGLGCFFSIAIAHADFHLGPVTSDDTTQQNLQQQYYNPQTQTTDFSFPSGVFRQVCTGCQYDMQNVSCYCQDINGMTSYFPTIMAVEKCQKIYDNRGGFLKCGD